MSLCVSGVVYFYCLVVFHFMDVLQLVYLFISWWTFTFFFFSSWLLWIMLPWTSMNESLCWQMFSFLLDTHLGVSHMISLFALLRKCRTVCQLDIPFYKSHMKIWFSPHPCWHLYLSVFFHDNYSSGCDMVFHHSFILHFSNGAEDLFMSLLTICISSLVKHLTRSLAHFEIIFLWVVNVS